MTLVPLFLIIFLTVFFIHRQSRKKKKEQREQFISICRTKGLQIDNLMQRRNRMAALSIRTLQIAWINLSIESMEEPLVLSLQPDVKHTLNIMKDKSLIQKIALKPVYKFQSKEHPEIIFYDWQQDDATLLDSYRKEAEEWEKALNTN